MSLSSPWKLAGVALVALASALAGGCSAETAEEEAVDGEAAQTSATLDPNLAQVNDVSILFPLAKSRVAFAAHLAPSATARGGPLLSKEIYERAFGPPGTLQIGGTPAAPALAGLRLVAVRFDPCFAERSPTNEGACKNQMRLVFQTLEMKSTGAVAADDAVHVFYALERDELTRAIGTMIALRKRIVRDRRLGALAPHPLLRTSNGDLDAAVAGEVNALVESLAGPANLVQLTQFAPSGLDTTWNFSGFDVKKNAAMVIPTLAAPDDTHVAFFAGFTPGQLEGDPAFVPSSKAPAADNMQMLGNRLTARAGDAQSRAKAFSAMLRIEHPGVHTPDTIDCASCHAVEPVRKLVGAKHFAADMNAAAGAFQADARWVPAADVARAPDASPSVNVHMFSYKGTTASIHTRTINESAAVVAHVNGRILSAGR